jgi:DNA-binding NarL/FixJ family response regulator
MHRILLVDDHPLLRDGVAHLIGRHDEYEVCGEADSAAEALEQVSMVRPDLVVMDMTLPDKSGLELIKDFQALCPEIPVLVLSMHDEMLYAERVIRAGGRGYIMKESAASQLMTAIKTVLDGGIVLSERASAHILGALAGRRDRKPRTRLEQLTDREFEVFEQVGLGKSAHAIGRDLSISPRTVDAHRAHIREKLGLPDSPSLMRYAVRWMESGSKGVTASSEEDE